MTQDEALKQLAEIVRNPDEESRHSEIDTFLRKLVRNELKWRRVARLASLNSGPWYA